MKKGKSKLRIMPGQKPLTKPLFPVPFQNRDNQVTGNIEMNVKIISIQQSKGSTDNLHNPITGSALTVFDGTDWETELVWMLAQIMKDQFKLGNDKIRETFKKVLKNL